MNIKKVGLTALAGSLAVVSAHAVDLSVSGKTEVTYVSSEDGATGNPFGMGNSIAFSGSGDVNGMTATYTAAIGDNGQASTTTSEVFGSASLMLDMGDLGTIGFDQGVGEFGLGTIDDKTPYAYEEQWTYTGGSTGIRAAGGSNVVGYKNSVMGYQLSLEIDPGHSASSGASGDGAGTGAGGATDSGWNVAITGSPVDGVSVGIGYGTESHSDDTATTGTALGDKDETSTAAFVTYAMGAATVGLQVNGGYGGSVGTSSQEVMIYGISYSVNENLAISYSEMDNDFAIGTTDTAGNKGGVTEATRGIGASYTMGSASVRALLSDTDNVGGNANNDKKHMELSLMLAF
jgi:outer membrane protein OmpU